MLRRLLAALFVLGLATLLVVERHELAKIGAALAGARRSDLAAALLLQLAAWAAFARLYQSALATAGAPCGWGEALAILMGALAVNLVAPSAGLAGAALWIDALGRRGRDPAKVAAGVWLAWAGDLSGLALLALAGLTSSFAGAGARASAALAPAAAFLAVAVMVAILVVAARRPVVIERALTAILPLASGVRRRVRLRPLARDWPHRIAASIAEAARPVLERPGSALALASIAFAAHAASALALGRAGHAFGAPLPFGSIAATYALAQVVWTLSPVPQGIGAVEGTIAAAWIARGVPFATAASIALVHRALSFWAPMIAGAIVLWSTRALRGVVTRRSE